MDSIELLECLITTEINKLKYQIRIAKLKGQANKIKAITNKISGLKTSLNFIDEINNMEE